MAATLNAKEGGLLFFAAGKGGSRIQSVITPRPAGPMTKSAVDGSNRISGSASQEKILNGWSIIGNSI
jgi:hypothetical protein